MTPTKKTMVITCYKNNEQKLTLNHCATKFRVISVFKTKPIIFYVFLGADYESDIHFAPTYTDFELSGIPDFCDFEDWGLL